MFTSTRSEKITQLLNEWYTEIRSRNIDNAHRMKEQIDSMIQQLKMKKRNHYKIKNYYFTIPY